MEKAHNAESKRGKRTKRIKTVQEMEKKRPKSRRKGTNYTGITQRSEDKAQGHQGENKSIRQGNLDLGEKRKPRKNKGNRDATARKPSEETKDSIKGIKVRKQNSKDSSKGEDKGGDWMKSKAEQSRGRKNKGNKNKNQGINKVP